MDLAKGYDAKSMALHHIKQMDLEISFARHELSKLESIREETYCSYVERGFIDEEDIKFYRKRILQTTKNYLRLNRINSEVDSAFENYAEQLIKHFKFIDKKEMVQKEYENLPKKKNKKISKFE